MRKALLPLVASLALCGAATAALIASNASAAQAPRKPVMIAQLAPDERPGPRAEGTPGMDRMMDRGEHRGQMCQEMYAHKVGELAFLEARLSLTGGQAPLFARWKEVSLDVAKRHQGECATRERHEPGQRRDVVERLNREETMLKHRLADIDAERPSLTGFYAALNPEQKQEFGHAAMRGMGGRMHMGMMGRHHGMGPMGRGPMGDAPPPAPPQ